MGRSIFKELSVPYFWVKFTMGIRLLSLELYAFVFLDYMDVKNTVLYLTQYIF